MTDNLHSSFKEIRSISVSDDDITIGDTSIGDSNRVMNILYSEHDLNKITKKKTQMRPLQFRIPTDVFFEFSEEAGREFGFTHGAKKQLFLKIWEVYKAQK